MCKSRSSCKGPLQSNKVQGKDSQSGKWTFQFIYFSGESWQCWRTQVQKESKRFIGGPAHGGQASCSAGEHKYRSEILCPPDQPQLNTHLIHMRCVTNKQKKLWLNKNNNRTFYCNFESNAESSCRYLSYWAVYYIRKLLYRISSSFSNVDMVFTGWSLFHACCWLLKLWLLS